MPKGHFCPKVKAELYKNIFEYHTSIVPAPIFFFFFFGLYKKMTTDRNDKHKSYRMKMAEEIKTKQKGLKMVI